MSPPAIHELRHSSGDTATAELRERYITIRARAADWCHLSALMAAVGITCPDGDAVNDANEWERLLDDIGSKERLL